jgi:hypothetical protein
MSAESMMQDGRQLAVTLLLDVGVIKRPGTGTGTLDPVTGDWTPPPGTTTVYSGRCRVRRPDALQQQVVFGDISATVSRYLVDLPFNVAPIAIGDVLTLTESDDPEILNVAMRVVSVVGKSVLMYRQLGLEVVE